jgi:hypothetical protein
MLGKLANTGDPTPANLDKIRLGSREEQPMTSFSEEDAARCFSCDEKPPEFRLIRLGKYLGKNRELIPDVSATLLCGECLGEELSEFHESLAQAKEPVAESESEDRSLVRDYGLLVVPLDLSKDEAELLIDELKTSGIEHKTH